MKFDHITVSDGLSQNTIHGIAKDKYGFMWFGTWEGLCRYDGYQFIIYRYEAGNVLSIPNNRIHALYVDPSGILWGRSFDSTNVFRYNYEQDNFTRIPITSISKSLHDSLSRKTYYRSSHAYSKNRSWVLTSDNILHYKNTLSGEAYAYTINPCDNTSLSDDYIPCIYLTEDQILWIGTYNGGVNKTNLNTKPFYHFHTGSNPNFLPDNYIRSICKDFNGNLWLGTRSKGLVRVNTKTNTFHAFNSQNSPPYQIEEDNIRKIYCDHQGLVWIGSKGGLNCFDYRNQKMLNFSLMGTNSIPDNWVYAIIEDRKANLWIGTWKGIAQYNRQNNQFDTYLSNIKRIRVIFEDSKGYFWIGTEGFGLFKYRINETHSERIQFTLVKSFQSDYTNKKQLSDNRIYAIKEAKDGAIWIGTGGGLDRLDPKTNHFLKFSTKNGLPDEMIMGILNGDHEEIWVSHKKGITRLNTKTFSIRNFSIDDGLQNYEFLEDACFKDTITGQMYFGGVKGYNVFQPDSIKDDKTPPRIYITQLRIFNQEILLNQKVNDRIILTKPIYLTQNINLTYKEKVISLEFAALHFSNSSGNLYKYMLEGFDKTWIETDAKHRLVTYSNLPPGSYTFKVLGANSDGVWNPTTTTLTITVLTPWWQTIWFRLFLLTFLLVSAISIYYYRIAIYRKRQEILEIMVRKRTRELEASNLLLLDSHTRIKEQSEELQTQTEIANQTNEVLIMQKKHIMEQTEELRTHSEKLQKNNDLLLEKQNLIQLQSIMLEETNKQLTLSNSTKDRFFSIIAHDLRNPFHAVSGFSDLLNRNFDKLTPEKIHKYLTLIRSSATHGQNLLENLLLWSRTQTGRIEYNPVKTDLVIIIEETLALLEGDALRKSVSITHHIDPEVKVFVDENMIYTVCRNIISNAIKFTPQNGSVNIYCELTNNMVTVTVADTGTGIAENAIPLLFRIDTTYSTTGTANETGTGLGLILCREFIARHNGNIWVESQKGIGSKFMFTLPTG